MTQPPAQSRNASSPGRSRWADRFPWAERAEPVHLASRWWIGHIPFAFELVARLRPATVVELGTYSGTSLAAFCQAARLCQAGSTCYGVDTWDGDIHMGQFPESLHNELRSLMEREFPGSAILVRRRFEAAAADFADRSIDLLHIDGTHTYEAVRQDFETWLPRVSDRGVVLLHDTRMTRRDVGPRAAEYGVGRFFAEVRGRYPHLEFRHSCGLGVLLVGQSPTPEVLELLDLSRQPGFQTYFAQRGSRLSRQFARRSGAGGLRGLVRRLLGLRPPGR